jgi:hypothetical protein
MDSELFAGGVALGALPEATTSVKIKKPGSRAKAVGREDFFDRRRASNLLTG